MLEKNAEMRPSVRDLLADPYVQALTSWNGRMLSA